MPEIRENHNNTNKFYVSPTDRLDLLSALTKEQAKEEAKGKKHRKLLEQVDLFVMMALIGHRNNKTGQCDPSHAMIAAEIGVSPSTVKRSFKRLAKAGFIITTPKYFKGLKSSSQVDIQFLMGEPWIIKSNGDGASMTEGSIMDDLSIGHRRPQGPVTDGLNDGSQMTDKHGEDNPENKHSENNTSNAQRRKMPIGCDGAGGEGQQQLQEHDHHGGGSTSQDKSVQDNQPAGWPTNWRDQFWSASPQRKNVAATERALIAVAENGVKLEAILFAARRRFKLENGYYRDPVKWLADEPWRDNHKPMPKRPESPSRPAI